jgi:hypothetical protein
MSHISSAPTVKLVHFSPTSSVYIFAVAMPRSPQSPHFDALLDMTKGNAAVNQM